VFLIPKNLDLGVLGLLDDRKSENEPDVCK